MLGDEGDTIACVVDALVGGGGAQVVVGEGGSGVAVGGAELEAFVEEDGAEGGFDSQTTASSGIDHDAAQAGGGETGQLLVTCLHIEGGEVELEGFSCQIVMDACFVAPGVFGFIVEGADFGGGGDEFVEFGAHASDDGLFAGIGEGEAVDGGCAIGFYFLHHGTLEGALAQLGVGLDVIASSAIAFGNGGVDVAQAVGQLIVD